MKNKRVVIKIGSSLITDKNGQVSRPRLNRIVTQLGHLHKLGYELLLVSSGAIATGRGYFHFEKQNLPEKQALAAIGQSRLMHIYEELFRKQHCLIAQVLLTRGDISDRTRYLNARNTLFTLLRYKTIPVINENDTVATEEIQFGDNDTLSALVASKVEADLLIILSDIKGLQRTIGKNQRKILVKQIPKITPEIEALGASTRSNFGTGGMFTKIQAAKIATAAGIPVIIADGHQNNIIIDLINGKPLGTRFLPGKRLSSRKRWIGFGALPSGSLVVDEGAENALTKLGKSLLPSGIVKVNGTFQKGEVVRIANIQGKEFARGLAAYDSAEINKIKGKQTYQIQSILGYKGYDEVIHRDNLTLLL